MATQKIGKMKRHEMGESDMYEKAEEKAVKGHFSHGGSIPEHRQKYYTMGKHAIEHREDDVIV